MRLLIGLFLFGFLNSCRENNPNENQVRHELKEVKPLFEDEEIFQKEIQRIDSDQNLIEVTSLEYLSNEGETFLVKGLVETKNGTKDMTLKKLTFKKISSDGNELNCSYYYLGTRKFASSCEKTILKSGDLIQVTTKSYYDDSSQVFFSKRLSGPSENLESELFKKCKPENHTDNLALKIINQEEEFETNFQGFTENMGKNYLILGTNNYTSTVAFPEYNSTLKLLKNNEKKYLGKKLIVDFSVEKEVNGFTFQALKDIRIAP